MHKEAPWLCPQCGGSDIESTCVGVISLPGETAADVRKRDHNRAKCQSCDWAGRNRDLVVPKASIRLVLQDPAQETERVRAWLDRASRLMTLLTADITCGVDFMAFGHGDDETPAERIAKKVPR